MSALVAAVRQSVQAWPLRRAQLGRRWVAHAVAFQHGRRLRSVLHADRPRPQITELWLDDRGALVHTACWCCPDAAEVAVPCSHVDSLMVRFLEGFPKVDDSDFDPAVGAPLAELEARLDHAGARDLLHAPAASLLARHDLRVYDAGGSVAAVLSQDDPAVVERWPPVLAHRVAGALSAELAARAAAAEPAPWRDGPPPVPALGPVWRALQSERRRRRRRTAALLPPGAPPPGTLTVSELPAGLHWTARGLVSTTTRGPVDLRLAWDGRLSLETGDGRVPVDRCPYALGLVELALDIAAGQLGGPHSAALVTALTRPAWGPALDALDAVLHRSGVPPVPDAPTGPAEVDPGGRQLGWQLLRLGADGWWLRAVWTHPTRRPGARRVEDLHQRDLLDREGLVRLQDRAVLRALGTTPAAVGSGLPAVFAAAAGHPEVIDARRHHIQLRVSDLALRWSPGPAGGLVLRPVDSQTGIGWAPADFDALLSGQGGGAVVVDAQPGAATVYPLSPAAGALLGALRDQGWAFPAGAEEDLLARLPAVRKLVSVLLDPALQGRACAPSDHPVIQLQTTGDGALSLSVRLRPVPGGPTVVPGEGAVRVEGLADGVRVYADRDLDLERDAILAALGDDAEILAEGPDARLPLDDDTLALVDRLQAAASAGRLRLEWTEAPLRVSRPAALRDVQLTVGGGQDWLSIGGQLAVDGVTVDIHRVVEALRGGRRFVRADAEHVLQLSPGLARKLGAFSGRMSRDSRGRAALAPLSSVALKALADGGAVVEMPPELVVEAERIEAALAEAPAPPPGLVATLRPYQAEGLAWLQRMAAWAPGACLADDMGLGKTLQALGLLLHRAHLGPALVVAPTSLAANWVAEAARFAPGLDLRSYRGRGRRRTLRDAGPGVVYVTSYDLMKRDVDFLDDLCAPTVVFDEAQALKNPATIGARTAVRLRGDFCLALSGTPVENRSRELWSLFRVLVPGLLGSQAGFQKAVAGPADSGDPGAQARLAALVGPFILRRTKAQVAKDLPARTELVQRIALSRSERSLYDAARDAALQIRATDPSKARFVVLQALTRLRQLACDPRLVDPESTAVSSKLAALAELVEAIVDQGDKVLVFSQFTRLLDRAGAVLGAHRQLRLDGSTPARVRAERVDAFQAGAADVFLISRQAGGTGLNLTAATYVVHLDPWWNPAAEDQATDRAHRIGQDRPVTVYRLIAENTVEEGVLKMQEAKRELVSQLMTGAKVHGAPSVEELLALVAGDSP